MFNFFFKEKFVVLGFSKVILKLLSKTTRLKPLKFQREVYSLHPHTGNWLEVWQKVLLCEERLYLSLREAQWNRLNSQGGSPDLNGLCPLDSRGHILPSPVILLSWLQSGWSSRVEEENTGKGDVFGQADLGRLPLAVFMKSKFPFLELKIKQLS